MWQSIQNNMSWRAVPIAGLIAGTVFLLVNVILTPVVLEVDSTLVLRYFGSLMLGENVILEDGADAIIVGVVLHYLLSILFTLVIAIVIHRWGLTIGIVGGSILSLSIYAINFYTLTIWFEWFFAINSDVLLLSHVLFGAVAGGVYELFDHYDESLGVNDE